jgi:hypothetical protein
MSTLTTDEKELATAVKTLSNDVQLLSSKMEKLADKVKPSDKQGSEYTPLIRFAITLTAQIGGFFLLWLLGSNTYSIDTAVQQPSIREGLEYIQAVERVYMVGSGVIIISMVAMLWYLEEDPEKHRYVDIMLLLFVVFDLFLLLFLVCQEGGLCRSMFLPVYFLIPTAYLAAERHSKQFLKRKLAVLSLILVCIYISYRYAAWAQPPQSAQGLQPANGTFHLLGQWWPINLTDFSTLAHRDYDEAVWFASCISALVPIIQIAAVMGGDKLKEIRDKRKQVSPSVKEMPPTS